LGIGCKFAVPWIVLVSGCDEKPSLFEISAEVLERALQVRDFLLQ
jgi:hypothetical protein